MKRLFLSLVSASLLCSAVAFAEKKEPSAEEMEMMKKLAEMGKPCSRA